MKICKIVNPKYASELSDFVASLERGDELVGEVVYKGRNTLVGVNVGGVDMVVKSYDGISAINRLVYGNFRQSKAMRSYNNASRLIELGFATPEPVAAIDVFKNRILRRSYYVCRRVEGFTMWNWDLRPDADELTRRFAEHMFSLHSRGVWLRDFNMRNTIVVDGVFNLVDLNRMTFDVTDLNEVERMITRNFIHLRNDRNHDAVLSLARVYAEISGKNPDTFVSAIGKACDDYRAHRQRMTHLKHPFRKIEPEV